MAERDQTMVGSHALARDFEHQRADVMEAAEHRARLEANVRRYEQQYGIESEDVHAAIDRGELDEDHDVCRWIIDFELLKRTEAT